MTDNFKLITNILFDKKNIELFPGDDCSTWVINKGLSFHSPSLTQLINHTTNSYHDVLSPQDYVDFLNIIIPKTSFRRIPWFKSDKSKKKSNNTQVISSNLEISNKELAEILEIFPEFIQETETETLKTYTQKSK